MAAMYRLGLELAGFSVTAARDADRALEALERDSFDLLLLDIQLPGTSGLDLLLMLRRMAATQAVPTVILTNYDDPEMHQLAMRRGASDYLLKVNTSPRQLVDRLRRVLEAVA